MATTIDEDLSQVEREIRKLKIEYEQFFGGGRSRPPTDTQWRVETLMKRYSDRSGELNVSQRFRYNNLSQTYAKYCDMWRKKTSQKEGAVTQHHFGAAAKEIEAARAQTKEPEPAAQPADLPAAKSTPRVFDGFALSFREPEPEKERVARLYENLLQARAQTGEAAGTPSFAAFERFVAAKTKELRATGGNEVEYSVSIEQGKAKLKARIAS